MLGRTKFKFSEKVNILLSWEVYFLLIKTYASNGKGWELAIESKARVSTSCVRPPGAFILNAQRSKAALMKTERSATLDPTQTLQESQHIFHW